MVYVPITYIPDGPVTQALKRRVRRRRPKPKLGNLGPLLDENLAAARKHGHFRYHPDDLRLLKGVKQNPEVVDDGLAVLRERMAEKGIAEPTHYEREAPYYPDVPSIVKFTAALAALMTVGITIAVLFGQRDAVAAMVVAIVAISLVGAAVFAFIMQRCVIRVGGPGTGL
ncbi:MAG: hypothetical protein ACRBK7_00100 [Acidimicrobiales bacterium]